MKIILKCPLKVTATDDKKDAKLKVRKLIFKVKVQLDDDHAFIFACLYIVLEQ